MYNTSYPQAHAVAVPSSPPRHHHYHHEPEQRHPHSTNRPLRQLYSYSSLEHTGIYLFIHLSVDVHMWPRWLARPIAIQWQQRENQQAASTPVAFSSPYWSTTSRGLHRPRTLVIDKKGTGVAPACMPNDQGSLNVPNQGSLGTLSLEGRLAYKSVPYTALPSTTVPPSSTSTAPS